MSKTPGLVDRSQTESSNGLMLSGKQAVFHAFCVAMFCASVSRCYSMCLRFPQTIRLLQLLFRSQGTSTTASFYWLRETAQISMDLRFQTSHIARRLSLRQLLPSLINAKKR